MFVVRENEIYELITGRQQANELLNAHDASTLKGKRDRVILALLISCGLRRARWPRSQPHPAARGPLGQSGSCSKGNRLRPRRAARERSTGTLTNAHAQFILP